MKPILAILCLFTLSACSTVRPGSQTSEVRAEQVLAVSLAALDSFVAFEHRRRADVPPLVRDVAQRVRREAPKALDSANALRLAYKSNRTAQNEANLFTALALVDSLLAEVRVWVPATSASGPDNRAVDKLIREAAASKTVTAQSWTVLVPVFIDLAKEIYIIVNRTREAVKQDREWSPAEDLAFAEKLAMMPTLPHWKIP